MCYENQRTGIDRRDAPRESDHLGQLRIQREFADPEIAQSGAGGVRAAKHIDACADGGDGVTGRGDSINANG